VPELDDADRLAFEDVDHAPADLRGRHCHMKDPDVN